VANWAITWSIARGAIHDLPRRTAQPPDETRSNRQSMSTLKPFESYEFEIYRCADDAVADLLGRGYGVNQPDAHGAFLLTVTCSRLHVPSVSRLLSSGAETEIRDPDGNTPLLCAIDVSHHNQTAAYEIVKALL
jgi:hypothetical protein